LLKAASDWFSNTRHGRYWMHVLANHDDLQPLVNLANDRVRAGLRTLARMGFSPQLVLDVGAHRGTWTTMALPIFPEARFLMLEAQSDKEDALRQVKAAQPHRVDYAIGLLGPEAQSEVSFFLADTGSSLYPENTSFARRETTLPMTTLDLAVGDALGEGEIFLKLDVQGAELDVIAGGERVLARSNAILTEVSLAEYNSDAPRVAEVAAAMAERGFLLFDIWDLRRIGTILAQADFLFVRRASPLDRHAQEQVRAYGR
jgi:FkbM family methyltransferase